jgi:hypothetical protein
MPKCGLDSFGSGYGQHEGNDSRLEKIAPRKVSPNNFRVLKSRRMRLMGHGAPTGEIEFHIKYFSENLKGIYHLRGLSVIGRLDRNEERRNAM